MIEPTLFIDGALELVIAAVLAIVARTLWLRPVPSEAARANRLFATWWAALSGMMVLSAAMRLLAAADLLSLSLYLTSLYVSIFVVCVAMGALLYYLLFLLVGRDLTRPIVAFYAGLSLVLVYYLAYSGPTCLTLAPWTLRLQYAREPGGWPLAATLVLLVGPHVLGAIGYFSLFFRVHDPTQRYRIALVAGSILAWVGSALLASELELARDPIFDIASRFVGLAAACTILLAYRPPEWVRRRLVAPSA